MNSWERFVFKISHEPASIKCNESKRDKITDRGSMLQVFNFTLHLFVTQAHSYSLSWTYGDKTLKQQLQIAGE